MRTRNSYFLNNSSATIPRRRNKRRPPNLVEPELRAIIEMADNHTMKELLQAPTEGYGEAIGIPEINADHFEIKMNLLQLGQANPYHGFERENPDTHINNFTRITLTLKFRDVPNDVIKLMMLSYFLEGNARVWYNKEPPSSIVTWEDLVNKFINQFFPPSKPPTSKMKLLVSLKDSRRHLERHGNNLRKCLERATYQLSSGNTSSLAAAKYTSSGIFITGSLDKMVLSDAPVSVTEGFLFWRSTEWELITGSGNDLEHFIPNNKLADQISTLLDIFVKKIVAPAPVKAG
nr:reverse transcriptase domain-containing protein [Tanacetum cinerariifolium]